jgi:hypothetical protein
MLLLLPLIQLVMAARVFVLCKIHKTSGDKMAMNILDAPCTLK